jgi:hypothetical protein
MEVAMKPIRQEVKMFVHGCEHLLSIGSAQGLAPDEADLIGDYLSAVENFLCEDVPEIEMHGTDAA